MRIDPSDPKITAYILGELNEAEKTDIEKILSEDEESRKYVEELRATTLLLETEFAGEPALALSSSHREAIENELAVGSSRNAPPVNGTVNRGFFPGFFGWRFGVAFSVAMVGLIASVAYFGGPRVYEYERTRAIPSTSEPEIAQAPLPAVEEPVVFEKLDLARSPQAVDDSTESIQEEVFVVDVDKKAATPNTELLYTGMDEGSVSAVGDVEVAEPLQDSHEAKVQVVDLRKSNLATETEETEMGSLGFFAQESPVTQDMKVASADAPSAPQPARVAGDALDPNVRDADGLSAPAVVTWEFGARSPEDADVEWQDQFFSGNGATRGSSREPLAQARGRLGKEEDNLARANETGSSFERVLSERPLLLDRAASVALAPAEDRADAVFFGLDAEGGRSGGIAGARVTDSFEGSSAQLPYVTRGSDMLGLTEEIVNRPREGEKKIALRNRYASRNGSKSDGDNLGAGLWGGPRPSPNENLQTETIFLFDENQRAVPWGWVPGVRHLWGRRLGEEVSPSLGYPGTEDYETFVENPFKSPLQEPLSTLSIDVDTASYSNARRFLNQGQLPPKDSIRIEEMINYFDYDYEQPVGDIPFAIHVEISQCPWKPEHQLARLGIQGKEIPMDDRGPANLVFLLDVSGSMKPANKLPLVKQGMKMLLNQLQPNDRVAIVTYAGSSGVALSSTPCSDKPKIVAAIEALGAGGSTNGASGIELAYRCARANFSDEGINRVILATDGDFNVGVTDRGALVELIEREAGSGVFLSVLGFGMGNLKDHNLESLADKGNGNYAYIDTLREAQKVFVDQLGGTLFTIAKDVKIQVEFNPGKVGAYRLIGYENRKLAAQDFNDDTKDAGEIGAGHTITALYELVPPGIAITLAGVDELKYQQVATAPEPQVVESDEMMTVKVRYKEPEGQTSKKVEIPVDSPQVRGRYAAPSTDFNFAAAVAQFGMILRGSAYKGNATLDHVLDLARQGKGADENGYRAEFLQLVNLAKSLSE